MNIVNRETEINEKINQIRNQGLGKAIFPFPKFEGTNSSEKILISLCQKSFLSLWTLPNLFKQIGKELADVLIIFGDDIIIISDKEGHSNTKDLKLKWSRYQKHIEKSQKQLLGAKRWITDFPNKIFLNAQCTEGILHSIPKNPKFHLITVLRGWKQDSKEYYKNNDGSLPIDTTRNDKLMSIRSEVINNSFIHVFDEIAIESILCELNTVSDFISYLNERECFFKCNKKIRVFGETPLLASFLIGRDKQLKLKLGLNLFETKAIKHNGLLKYNHNIYYQYILTDHYVLININKSKSIFVDYLIEKFINLGDPKESYYESDQSIEETEHVLREFAKTYRQQRIDFYNCLQSLIDKCLLNQEDSPVRTFLNPMMPDTVFIILLLKKLEHESLKEYRVRRRESLMLHCLKAQSSQNFIYSKVFLGFATDHVTKNYEGFSEDLIAIYQTDDTKYQNYNKGFLEDITYEKIISLTDNSLSQKKHIINNIQQELSFRNMFFPNLENTINDFIRENLITWPFKFILKIKETEVSFHAL